MLGSGARNKRITVMNVAEESEYGELTSLLVPIKNLWGNLKPLKNPSEIRLAMGFSATCSHLVTVIYDASIHHMQQLLIDGKYYTIDGVNSDSNSRETYIYVTEQVDASTPIGFSGYSGAIAGLGYSGYSGIGTSGYSGRSGYSGISGYSGANPGASGYSGRSGFSGFSGTTVSTYKHLYANTDWVTISTGLKQLTVPHNLNSMYIQCQVWTVVALSDTTPVLALQLGVNTTYTSSPLAVQLGSDPNNVYLTLPSASVPAYVIVVVIAP